jgi:iron complex transport system ATP-binding protein
MDRGTPVIEIKNLSFSYAGKSVLSDISLSIGKNETWSFIGKNGAGKSTLIKCIAGLLPVNPGAVLVKGVDIQKQKPRERAKIISYVPQAAGRTLPAYSVYDYVMLGRFPYRGLLAIPNTADRKAVMESLCLTDTIDLEDRCMTTLSGGELQRVFLAGAVAQQAEVLLLDEPATFLDPLHQEIIRKTLDKIHNEFGMTILTITHDVNTAIIKNDNILALVNGRPFYAGTTSVFLNQCPSILQEIFSIPFETSICVSSNRSIIVPGEIP